MGLIATDLPMDMLCLSGVSQGSAATAAICSPPWRNPTQDSFVLHQGTCGQAYVFLSFTPSGGNIRDAAHTKTSLLESAVNEIGLAFGLNRTEIAQACQVTRKTLYNWIDETSTPKRETMSRIYDLLFAARSWKNAGVTADRETLHTPVIDNKSLFDLLTEDVINTDLIVFAGSKVNLLSTPVQALPDPFS